MRKLMWLTLGFGAACCYCAYTWTTSNLILPALLCLVLFGLSIYAGNQLPKLKMVAAVALGISLGLLWFHGFNSLYLSDVTDLDGKDAEVTLNCTDYGVKTDYGTAVEGFLSVSGKPCRAKFYVNGDIEIEPGDVLSGMFSLRVTTQDSEKGATYHQGKGMFLLGYQEDDAALLKVEKVPYWAYPSILRHNLTQFLDQLFPVDVRGFAKALLLGDRSEISYKQNTDFKVTGIMHIIAVSGLHVTILFTLINLLCLKRRWLVALLGIPTLVLFAAVAGFTPSITRACIMQCLMIGAMLFNREYDGPTELSFAALVMLVVNPLVVTSVSFQLSIGCMAGIFLFQKRIYDWLCQKLRCGKQDKFTRLKRWLASSVSVTLSAISLTTPLSAYYFGAVSLVGVFTNLLTLWVVAFAFYGILLSCILGATIPSVGAVIAGITSMLCRYIVGVSDLFGRIPFAAVYTQSPYIVAWLIFTYLLLAVFMLSARKRPGMLLTCCMLGLLISIGASRLELTTDACRMTVLDVGQGQSIILQSEGRTYLVDCGGDYDDDAADLAAETLLSQGITSIDALILTHFDRDHAGGAVSFLNRIPAEEIYVPAAEDISDIQAELCRIHDSVTEVTEELQIFFDTTILTLYPPVVTDSDNEGSLAVLFQSGNCDILITGDRSSFGERILLKESHIPELDILVAGHHGSKNSTSAELLAATRPGIVAISVGNNAYGHPATDTLDRLESFGCTVYRTDLHGTLIFRR